MSLSSLNRKLFRDLWAMKGQAFAIAMVVASGVAMFVMYQSNFDSLWETRGAYYERQRFGHVFASLKRAPDRLAADIAAIPGVSAMETRVVSAVTLDLEQLDEPASAQLVSIPANRRPRCAGTAPTGPRAAAAVPTRGGGPAGAGGLGEPQNIPGARFAHARLDTQGGVSHARSRACVSPSRRSTPCAGSSISPTTATPTPYRCA